MTTLHHPEEDIDLDPYQSPSKIPEITAAVTVDNAASSQCSVTTTLDSPSTSQAPPIFELTRSAIGAALQGQPVSLPNLDEIYINWPKARSPHLGWLRNKVNERIYELLIAGVPGLDHKMHVDTSQIRDGKDQQQLKDKVQKLRTHDIGFYVAALWPDASQDESLAMAQCALWLVMWQSGFDAQVSRLVSDDTRVKFYCQRETRYITKLLKLREAGKDDKQRADVNITSFLIVVAALERCSFEQRARLHKIIQAVVEARATAHEQLRSNGIPTVAEYIKTRVWGNGMMVLCGMWGLLTVPDDPGVFLGPWEGNAISKGIEEDLQIMATQTGVMVSIAGDLLSLEKDVARGNAVNVVPILWSETRNLDDAIRKAVCMMKDAKKCFDAAEMRVRGRYTGEAENFVTIERCIEALKTNCTGTIAWRLRACTS